MSDQEFLPFALPDVGEEEASAVVDAIRSGWLSSGPKVRDFEANFAAALGNDLHAVAVNSATAGLHLAIEALGVGPGDEVIVPTWTFTATAEVVRYVGAEPILVDVTPDTLNLDLRAAETALTSRTRAIMPVHFAGNPILPSRLDDFGEKHGVAVVEDAAHAFPAARGGVRVGSNMSAATVFSFYATKTMTTGEGGMLVTRHGAIAERVRIMRLHGIDRDAFNRYRSSRPSWEYEVIAPGYKYNMHDMAAAMGIVQLRRAEAMRLRRQDIAERYIDSFADLPVQLPSLPSPDDVHAWHLFVIRLPQGTDRNRFIDRLAADGIGTSVHFIPLHKHPYWRNRYELKDEDFPVASAEFDRAVSLPIYSSMSDRDVDRAVRALTAYFA